MPLEILFKCLAEQTRLKCIILLLQHDELCVCDLTEMLQLSQPKISRHLATLRLNGLVQTQRKEQWIYYRLSDHLSSGTKAILKSIQANYDFTKDKQKLECC
ncbi:metalloregulator ArsR/SmtB family transcription factor [Kangiella sp. TOML190]|uniref:ArsR/SmtB family transcription factor n=1 Tax=Kangiella sp. TOML190 TaxID=2931351 RepID=UPI00203D1C9D|nr:metalloregulator ArsR/SmtB family transcription factor [Kangiella sp. TOML190]